MFAVSHSYLLFTFLMTDTA